MCGVHLKFLRVTGCGYTADAAAFEWPLNHDRFRARRLRILVRSIIKQQKGWNHQNELTCSKVCADFKKTRQRPELHDRAPTDPPLFEGALPNDHARFAGTRDDGDLGRRRDDAVS